MTTSTWARREDPILRAVVEGYNSGQTIEDLDDLAARTGISRAEINVAVPLLVREGYMTGLDAGGFGGPEWMQIKPTGKSMRLVGAWPSDALAHILSTLDELVVQAHDKDSKAALVRIREGFASAGKDVALKVIASIIAAQATS